MIRHGVDQAGAFAKSRYLGKQAPANIARDLKLLHSILNVEQKHSDSMVAPATVTSTSATIFGGPTVAQGTTSQTRTGDSIKLTQFDINLVFSYDSGSSNTILNQVFRYYIVRYLKTPSASGTTAPNISEFLTQDVNSNYTPMSFPNPDTAENFHVIDSGQVNVVLSAVISSAVQSSTVVVPISSKVGFHQTYNGSGATNICDNMCFIYVVAQNAINTGGHSTVGCAWRMYYVDN
jgi:hypothetical protein